MSHKVNMDFPYVTLYNLIETGNAAAISDFVTDQTVQLDLDQPFAFGRRTPLTMAIHLIDSRTKSDTAGNRCPLSVVEALLTVGCGVNAADGMGDTPLTMACRSHGNEDLALLLVKHRSRVNLPQRGDSTGGWTPLHFAVSRSDLPLTQLLLENGADPNAVNHSFSTPLHFAVKRRCVDSCRLLLLAGADSHYADNQSCSAIHYAAVAFSTGETRRTVLLAMLAVGADMRRELNNTGPAAVLTNPHVDRETIRWMGQLKSIGPLPLSWHCRQAIVKQAAKKNGVLTAEYLERNWLDVKLTTRLKQFLLVERGDF